MSQITMLSAKNVHKILQVSHAKAYEIIRSLNAELKEKGFSVVDIGNRVGHKSSEITFRYANMFPNKQQEMREMLEEVIDFK